MPRRRRYYLGRIHKMGRLNDALLMQALIQPAIVHARHYAWTFTDASVNHDAGCIQYVFGRLSKFHPQGVIRVVDEESRVQDERDEPNLLIAASPFVYLPQFSGIAYQHVWNQIERKAFTGRFSDIVGRSHGDFFVGCEVEPITDLRTFVTKLTAIETFLEIHAKVHPPNPLFGRVWISLGEHLRQRSTSELSIKEKGEESRPILTRVADHMRGILAQTDHDTYAPDQPVDLTDAAVLMAADGYGNAKIVGKENGSLVTVRTSESQKSFLFDADPDPNALFEEASRHFRRINEQRNLEHQ